jgi:O-succinylbenzoate synthase
MPTSVCELEGVGPVEIGAIDAIRVSVPMTEPFRISSGEVSRKEAVLVRLENGRAFGWGESSAMPGGFYSQDTPDSCENQLLQILPRLPGTRFNTMRDLETWLLAAEISPFARVAIETAAWEMMARQQEQSLREVFGLPQKAVETGLAVGLYPTLEELRQALARYEVLRYRRLKIKIKRGHDIELVRAVREWYGDVPLLVDANADYTPDDMDVLRELDRFGLMMIEQPFARADMGVAVELQRQITTPLCFDEGIESAADVQQAAKADACRIVNIKLQRVGGFLEGLRVAEACVAHNLPFWMGTMPELGIGSAQALVLATHPACAYPTDVEPSARWYMDDVLQPELRMRDGLLEVPDGAGLGFIVDEAAVQRYTTANWSFRG